jgi:hypothetical protein
MADVVHRELPLVAILLARTDLEVDFGEPEQKAPQRFRRELMKDLANRPDTSTSLVAEDVAEGTVALRGVVGVWRAFVENGSQVIREVSFNRRAMSDNIGRNVELGDLDRTPDLGKSPWE